MYTVEQKNIRNKPYFYIVKRVRIGKTYKKISVYAGKSAPTDMRGHLLKLRDKELLLVPKIVSQVRLPDPYISEREYAGVEEVRIRQEYDRHMLSDAARERWWRTFAIRFIFESNAIEGSKLSQEEVHAIASRGYVKKSLGRKEVREVENAIRAFDLIRGDAFRINQRSIIALHALVTSGLDIASGYKKNKIVVNNKETAEPGQIRTELAKLIRWWRKEKMNGHPFYAALIFHQRFERIHPFEDGNGRVGRLLLTWMLLCSGYGVILFKNKRRAAYFAALDKADNGDTRTWLRHAMRVYRNTDPVSDR